MRLLLASLIICALAGCAGSPPKPPLPSGEYRPINAPRAVVIRNALNFAFDGDILGVLPALQQVAPQITALQPVGTPQRISIKVDLRGATVDAVFRAVAEQSKNFAEVVVSTTAQSGTSRAYVRFYSADETTPPN